MSYRLKEAGPTPFALRYGPQMAPVTLLVDRFHFMGHAATDVHCRTVCNPLAHNLTGLVINVIPPLVVPGPGADAALLTVEGKKSTFTVRARPHRAPRRRCGC